MLLEDVQPRQVCALLVQQESLDDLCPVPGLAERLHHQIKKASRKVILIVDNAASHVIGNVYVFHICILYCCFIIIIESSSYEILLNVYM